jgi:bifunctional DNA-binding transcriptional regulator/antitoxin component of YhaV-PrlF toxin-antitoxin module
MATDEGYNVTKAVTGCSLTLLFPKCIAEELGIRNGEILKFDVNGNRLIEKYKSPVTKQTSVIAHDKNRFELRNIKVAENRIGSLQRTRRLVTMCAGCNERNDNHN